jgi:hypothetical protein
MKRMALKITGHKPFSRAAMLLAAAVLIPAGVLSAEVAPPEYVLQAGEEWRNAEKTVEGEVVQVNPARIVLEYDQKGTSVREIHLDLGNEKDITFVRLKGLKDIATSDVVRVLYADKYVENAEGLHTQYKRTVKEISLVKRGTGANALVSGEAQS